MPQYRSIGKRYQYVAIKMLQICVWGSKAGHDPVVTQRIYAHMFEDDAVDAMATLDKVLRRL